jgi:glycosyltransferase involved in cell wall biosynthesis
MRILHLCDSLNPAGLGGYESYLHYLSHVLASQGNELFIATQSPSRNSPESVAQQDCTLFYLSGNLLEARKWEFLSLPDNERISAASSLFREDDISSDVEILSGQLRNLVRDLCPDVIHAHSTYVVFNRVVEILRRDGMLGKIPALATIHGLPKTLILPGGQRTTDYEQLAECCPFDRITAVSRCVAAALHAHLPARIGSAIQMLYLGVDLSVFRPQLHAMKRWDLAFFGRLEQVKAVDLLPEMMSMLRSDLPGLRLAITGEGSLRKRLLDEFNKKDVIAMTDYLGVVPFQTIPDLLNSIRVFLYPSREEALGLSLIEAMACGVPVITTNVLGPSEIVSNGYDGLAVRPGDVVELARAARRLVSDSQLCTRLGQNAVKTVKKRFDLRKHARALLLLYQSLQHTA